MVTMYVALSAVIMGKFCPTIKWQTLTGGTSEASMLLHTITCGKQTHIHARYSHLKRIHTYQDERHAQQHIKEKNT